MLTSRVTMVRSSLEPFIWKLCWRSDICGVSRFFPADILNKSRQSFINIWYPKSEATRIEWEERNKFTEDWASWLFSDWHYICLPQPAARNFNTGLLPHLRSSIASCILFINRSRKYNSIEIIYLLCQPNNATYLVIQKIRIGNVFQYLLGLTAKLLPWVFYSYIFLRTKTGEK